ncbi:hypothetical protein VPBG_00033 [Vibrio phage helene 12B3]|uniref:hypothetical protein n=1 Tax=Vibrio phage helene 12B3 TaxID=573173 RepID=UPI0002C0479A|nr:hypothetical protein VPBG_00033 [Vibrio phage helene 12B3]AGG57805.1 hypothetical protein VPBG_00033 [Vibrio phage helene 12B3]
MCYNSKYKGDNMSIRKELSSILREYKVGITYKEISEGTGVSMTSVRYAMNGGENVGLEVFQKLIDFLEVPLVITVDKNSYLM